MQFITTGVGTAFAKAVMPGACNILPDGISVLVNRSAKDLNAGPRTAICGNHKFMLHAGTGLDSYQWQDGSIGENYEVTQAGVFHVTVTDACGKTRVTR